jgi:peptide/nickel transport system substrate-binding protein
MIRISRRAVLAGAAALPLVPRAARAREAGTLIFGLSSYPPSLQPFASTGTAALTVKSQLFRGLLSFGPNGDIQPELAASYERDGDTGWKFTLRDAVFHNGAKVTSADVKATIAQIAGEKSTAYLRGALQTIDHVETPDERTVTVVMKQPTVTLPLLMAEPFAPILFQGGVPEARGEDGLPIGTGPYTIAAQERGVSIDLVAFDKFYKPGLPKTKKLRFVAYADENLRVAAVQAGDVDMIEYVPWQSMPQIEADPKLKLSTVDGPFMALAFNGGSGPFKDERLRRAVALAIRREEIVQAAFFGRGTVLEGLPIPKESPFYDRAYATGWRYDPAAAKKLMAEAGVGGGFACTLLSTAQYGMHKATAEIVQQHLGEIGIAVTLTLPDWATRVSLGNRGQYEFCVQGQATDNNDPDGLASYIDGDLPPDNSRSFHLPTPQIHRLLAEGRAEFDEAKRHAIYDELQKVALEVVPLASLCWRSQGYAMAKDVTGFTNLPGGLNFYSGNSLETTTA